mgnify:CR=1 FL=1
MALTTCLWSPDNRALEMAEYYTSIFADSQITTQWLYDEANPHLPGSKKWDVMIVEFTLMWVSFATLNGGPYFHIDPSISFFVNSSDTEEIQRLWDALSEWWRALMPIGNYPWSERYGWIEDKYGVSWQIFHKSECSWQRILPCLAFTQEKVGKAEEAMNHYSHIFANSGVDFISKYEKWENGGVEWSIKHAQFHIGDFSMCAMDASGPHTFDFSCAVSFMVNCKNQEELDLYYGELSAFPEAEMCWWISDKYGVSWQLIPKNFTEYMGSDDADKKSKLMKGVMEMKRLSWESIKKAYNS